jgi:hypothetical protein
MENIYEKENSETIEEEAPSIEILDAEKPEIPETSGEQVTPKPERTSTASDNSEKEKNARLFARAKKAEEELRAVKEQLDKSKKAVPQDEGKWKSKIEFLLNNSKKNYSEEEFEHIAVVAQEKGITLDDAAKKEEDYINYQREKVEKANKVPGPSSPAGGGIKSPHEMTAEEHKKFFEESIKRQMSGGTGI